MKSSASRTSAGPRCGGITAAEAGNSLFFSRHLSKSVAFQQSSVPKLLVARPQSLLLKHATSGTLDPVPFRKSTNFQACFRGNTNQKNKPQGLHETPENRLRNHRTISSSKHLLCNTFYRKTGFGEPQASDDFASQIGTKRNLETNPKIN